ncbi:hypothetical protein [uncultured Sphingomonas sp.]|jgi:hypothetical protein|uniref:hypothetical protein n=1 Tax=uncultured Sphingomonas sp. TaxID=158754 RepID=UPI002620DF76|nr:hypothetical protein [uncultured Sphingomonas sp.]
MSDKQPMQADGGGTTAGDGAEIASRQGGAGESGGGAYPNPHSGKPGKTNGPGSFLGHGGQSEIAYSGGANPNATAKED